MQGIALRRQKGLQDHFPAWIENIIIVFIILVVIQTILDDLSTMLHWPHKVVGVIIIAGFAFDLFFSLEFGARSIISARRGQFMGYIKHQRGWIDLLSSVPLLVLVSGPALYILLVGNPEEGGAFAFLSVLKTIKAIRVARILRLLRIIKLFGKIQNTNSVMTGRQVGTISTIAVVSLIMVLIVVEFVPGLRIGNHTDYFKEKQDRLSALFNAGDGIPGPTEAWLKGYLESNPDQSRYILRVTNRDGKTIFKSPDIEELRWTAYPKKKDGSHLIDMGNGFKAEISHFPADQEHSRMNLLILIGILVLVGSMMTIYTGIFARQVADPVFIMDKGLRDMDYNLEVKLDTSHADDEVFRLAKAYNVRWLPLKNQIANYRKNTQEEKSILSVDDIL